MGTAAMGAAVAQRGWSTLRMLKAARSAILLLDGLLLITILSAIGAQRAALTMVGSNTAPTIIAADHIRSAMAGMDANAANELLQAPGPFSGNSLLVYENRRVEAARALIAAAENITFGEAERTPIQSLQVSLGTYERLVQRARDLHQRGDPGAVAAYREAAAVMDTVLMPAAAALDKANDDVLERTYRSETSRSSGTRFLLIVFVLGTLGALVVAQVVLSQRMQRTANPLLLVATVMVVLMSAFFLRSLSTAHESLRVAKEDAFTSVHALWQARAAGYAAYSDESRYLLDQPHAAEHQESWSRNAAEVGTFPAGLDADQLQAALRERRRVNGFSGDLARELNNVTFAGEREAALETVAAWQRYLAVNAQMRQLGRSGQQAQAVNLCIGSKPGQSNWAFQRFDDALWTTLAINQAAFYASVSRGYAALHDLEVDAVIGSILVAVLVVLGLAPRLREYR